MNDDHIGKCWHCGQPLGKADYGRETDCPGCGKATRACRNCRRYSPGLANDCAEPLAEPVLDKGRANFCEYFDPAENPLEPGQGQEDAVALRQAAEDLFKL